LIKKLAIEAHSRNVTNLTGGFANYLGLEKNMVDDLIVASIYHDHGKYHIPEDVLMKPDKLTVDEFELLKEHVTYGVEYLEEQEFNVNVIKYVKDHHENYDGSGYPSKKRAYEISEGGRILRITDVFSALTEGEEVRPYKKALSSEYAIDIMKRDSHLFDEHLLIHFVRYLQSLEKTECDVPRMLAIV